MFRPSRNFKVPQVFGGQWKDHQTFQKWDPVSKRLVQVSCCGPIVFEEFGGGPTGPTGPCPPPDPVDSVVINSILSDRANVSWVYGGSETIFEVNIYEGSTSPVNTSGTPVFSQGGSLVSPYSAAFTPTNNYYYVASVRVKNDCGFSTYVYSSEVQYIA